VSTLQERAAKLAENIDTACARDGLFYRGRAITFLEDALRREALLIREEDAIARCTADLSAGPGTCTRCGASIPVNLSNEKWYRLTSYWRGKKNQDHDYCSMDCIRRGSIQGLVDEATTGVPDSH
jgi:hypothetical protein